MPAQLYLVSPPLITALDGLARQLAQLCAGAPIAAFRLELPGADVHQLRAAAAALFPVVQAAGTAAIIAGDGALAQATGADGVHLPSAAPVVATRRSLGPDISIGVACGTSRHDAMVAAEAGADYVEFGPFGTGATESVDPSLLSWWQELMEVPCVAGPAVSLADAEALVSAGADFLAIGGAFWSLDASEQASALSRYATACELPFSPGA